MFGGIGRSRELDIYYITLEAFLKYITKFLRVYTDSADLTVPNTKLRTLQYGTEQPRLTKAQTNFTAKTLHSRAINNYTKHPLLTLTLIFTAADLSLLTKPRNLPAGLSTPPASTPPPSPPSPVVADPPTSPSRRRSSQTVPVGSIERGGATGQAVSS